MKINIKTGFISSFIIKIVALVTMTFDHVGLLLQVMYPYDMSIAEVANVFRIIGRLALPLFVFMIVEGVIHTKNIKKYFLRLGIMAALISIVLLIIAYGNFGIDTSSIAGAGNIFLDLLLAAVAVYFLKQENPYVKFLILLPLAISVASFSVKCFETATGDIVLWYPTWLYLQYDWFSILLAIMFYFSYKFCNYYIDYASENDGIDKSVWLANGNLQILIKLLQVFSLVVVSFLYYSFKYLWPNGVFWDVETQLYAMISGAFILCYNGKRGYNAKWFQYGSYLYYPLHLLVIILIFIIANGGL
ncbi:MAG: conjugal transfer protein TraX [Bacilli bacterium]|nr:conjugal transfer protein TraX [Bacilli bacterium]